MLINSPGYGKKGPGKKGLGKKGPVKTVPVKTVLGKNGPGKYGPTGYKGLKWILKIGIKLKNTRQVDCPKGVNEKICLITVC